MTGKSKAGCRERRSFAALRMTTHFMRRTNAPFQSSGGGEER